MVQILASILFFVVFTELLIALTLHLIITIRDFIQEGKRSPNGNAPDSEHRE